MSSSSGFGPIFLFLLIIPYLDPPFLLPFILILPFLSLADYIGLPHSLFLVPYPSDLQSSLVLSSGTLLIVLLVM